MPNLIKIEEYYRSLFVEHGNSPNALGWHKGNQFLRFHQLTHLWNLNNSSILDVGCGFGDFNKYLQSVGVVDYNYLGIDLMNDFVNVAKEQYPQNNIDFIAGDFLSSSIDTQIDYSIASGTFNYRIEGVDCYDYVYENMKKMFEVSSKAIAVDFLTDRVDYFHEHNFNYSPIKILEIAYSLSKRVVLNNSVFPFEFAVIVYKDDSFKRETTVFSDIK
jgi:SAM-dependent methyltransferase